MNWLIENEPLIRLSCFAGIFFLMLLWEAKSARRPFRTEPNSTFTNLKRRVTNISLSVVNTLALRLLPALSAVAVASYASQQQGGLLNWLNTPIILGSVIAIILLDMLIYFQHRIFHYVPMLWRLHRVHHSDEHFDTTTAIRFHPVEILLSMLIKMIAVFLLGAPVAGVILFEIILNGGALFNHGNISLPEKLDNMLRKVIVTPDMHRVHHSIHYDEMNRNFGFNFSFWDRLFKSYCAQPRYGHDGMEIGLPKLRGTATRSLFQLIAQPWRRNQSE